MPYDNNADITVFAKVNYRNQERQFGIKRDDRRRHMYLIGKTGMGKSTILENMIIDDIREGAGVGVVDPHGDLAEKILEYIPSYRINDVVYINPSDFDYPVGFNILETVDPRHKHLVASGLMGVFKKIWPDVWSARMEYILNNTLLALMDYPGSTMLGVNRMFSDKAFRNKVVDRVTDPVVKSFWRDQFAGWTEKFASEATAAIENKVGQFLSASVIRNIVGQVKSSIQIREMMDSGKIIIMNLSKGRIGEDNSRLLGGMLITKIQLAAMERVEILEKDRRDFYLYVDEFQNFATESFANILSEARKYRLDLVIAHQYIEQLDEQVAAAVFGNVGTLISFRVGATDAEVLVKEFTPRFVEEDLVNIPKYNFYLKLMIDGVASEPFSATGLPPLTEEEKTGNFDKVIASSRERYAEKREVIEEKIMRWAVSKDESVASSPKSSGGGYGGERRSDAPRARAPEPEGPSEKKPHHAICSRCGKDVWLSFQPDGLRPVYCNECFKLVKDQKDAGVAAPASRPPVSVPVARPEVVDLPATSIPTVASRPVEVPSVPIAAPTVAPVVPTSQGTSSTSPSISLKEIVATKPVSFDSSSPRVSPDRSGGRPRGDRDGNRQGGNRSSSANRSGGGRSGGGNKPPQRPPQPPSQPQQSS